MIVVTAGHIDHGKTALVRALTGVDADRLAEEKRRGMTLDLGFAYRPADDRDGDEIIGFVDVPGHERLVRTMVAGATGGDFALLVVAADDGVMPQTREHLAVLDLLGLAAGAIAVTKIDRVAPGRVAEVAAEARALAAPTGLAGAPVFPVSALTGEGIAALASHIARAASAAPAPPAGGHFRLAVDRAFTLAGAGLVVTGTVHSGVVEAGETLVLSPPGIEVRVRGIHAQNRPAERARRGDRAALNIAAPGLDKDRIGRGDWLVAPPIHAPTARFDALVRVPAAADRPLAHWTPVHLHLGAADVGARVAVLGAGAIAPGGEGLARLVLDRPIGALAGDRFVIRDQSARSTLAGGRVVDPEPPARGRGRPQRLSALAALAMPDHDLALARLLAASPEGVDLSRFARGRNLTPGEAEAVVARASLVRDGGIAIAPRHFAALAERVVEALAAFHEREPDRLGPEPAGLARNLAGRPPLPLVAAALRDLAEAGRIGLTGGRAHLAGHRPALSPGDARDWIAVEAILDDAGLAPPVVHDIARHLGRPAADVARLMRRAEAVGLVTRIGRSRFALPGPLASLAEVAERLARDGRLTPAAFRDETGIGRNLAVEVLEHFDRAGLTRRDGEARLLLRPAAEIFAARL